MNLSLGNFIYVCNVSCPTRVLGIRPGSSRSALYIANPWATSLVHVYIMYCGCLTLCYPLLCPSHFLLHPNSLCLYFWDLEDLIYPRLASVLIGSQSWSWTPHPSCLYLLSVEITDICHHSWFLCWGSNPELLACRSHTLPTELHPQSLKCLM